MPQDSQQVLQLLDNLHAKGVLSEELLDCNNLLHHLNSKTNPIRALRARRQAIIAALEKYFDTNPLGQKIAQHIVKAKEILAESLLFWLLFQLIQPILVRQRLRKRLADYIKNVQEED
ncbi:unnamed protein product [Schistocephalus solidus]|uniref:Uncharacterized protein n=1 Tax=Schistocephalus solidus TaxID=70667 RepID=A0A3P7DAA6_SCHSO|nr:unnamed protein product [Schistocephalus solidus]